MKEGRTREEEGPKIPIKVSLTVPTEVDLNEELRDTLTAKMRAVGMLAHGLCTEGGFMPGKDPEPVVDVGKWLTGVEGPGLLNITCSTDDPTAVTLVSDLARRTRGSVCRLLGIEDLDRIRYDVIPGPNTPPNEIPGPCDIALRRPGFANSSQAVRQSFGL